MTTQTLPRTRSASTSLAPETPTRLTREFSSTDPTVITDLLSILMANIEDSLLQSGAKPGVDYTFRDLAGWAMPLIAEGWREGKLSWTAPSNNSL